MLEGTDEKAWIPPSFLVQKPDLSLEIFPSAAKISDLPCSAPHRSAAPALWVRELSSSMPPAFPQSASSGSLLVNSGSQSFCQLALRLSARFYASEVSKFMVMPVLF
ncbi:hypothetical protein SLEP1_g3724 [Rubroshorea leprosula]|uniref:Uncharacterized protein n=2 Tax=Rubroshorea leprosula TaxID=152421 RepID=A0AAV5HVY6_9ROSI|nr:hypothetical protein SLEP1_g3724 [Rubroshorea leprosula]